MTMRNVISASLGLLLLLSAAAPAFAGSATQPGDTMGSASGAATPPGFYFANQTNLGCADTPKQTCVATNIPMVAWSPGWTLLGAKVAFATAPATVVNVHVDDTYHELGFFNPFLGSTFNWDLGNGWGFTYLLGAYFDLDSDNAYSSTSLNQRFALSYVADGWNLTGNVIWGDQLDERTNEPQGFPCPTAPQFGCNPDFVNLDLTATRKHGKWEWGAIGFHSSDISSPIAGYRKQKKAAVGGLVGYWATKFIFQAYVTTEIYERNYGGKDTRLWTRIVVPLGQPPGPGHRAIAQ